MDSPEVPPVGRVPSTGDLTELARIIRALGEALTQPDCDKLDGWASTRTC
ncbi:hypothetical protein ABT324_27520 [Saccharopolyspora sp. NPDC000359]